MPKQNVKFEINDAEKGLNDIGKRRMTMPASTTDFIRNLNDETRLDNESAQQLEKRLKKLASEFSSRTKRIKEKIKDPITPQGSDSDDLPDEVDDLYSRLKHLTSPPGSAFGGDTRQKEKGKLIRILKKFKAIINFFSCRYILDPDGWVYISWLMLTSACFLYNVIGLPLRTIFPYQTPTNQHVWQWCDHFSDIVYLLDIIVFKSHKKYIKDGFWIKDAAETRKTYFETDQFKMDLASLIPLDIVISTLVGGSIPILRLPRLLKIGTYEETFDRLDTVLSSPYIARVTKTMFNGFFVLHMHASLYYGLSAWEGIGSSTWTYNGEGTAYVRCIFFAAKTVIGIGRNAKPEHKLEYLYMAFAWLSGVFITAVLIGQFQDIIKNANRHQDEYRAVLDATVRYLNNLGVHRQIQKKVVLWLSYTFKEQKTLDEGKILDLLPDNMRTDVALDLHIKTLSKVTLFHHCEVSFLRELVVKLKSTVYLPGDYVCKKGEVGREMFIIRSGKIHVIGGPSGTQILVTLGQGSVFGEIALLVKMTKRTADVRAGGFANLFVLTKDALEDTLKDYPVSQAIIEKKAKKLMKANILKAKMAAEEEAKKPRKAAPTSIADALSKFVMIKPFEEDSKFIGTMKLAFPPETKVGSYISERKISTLPTPSSLSPNLLEKSNLTVSLDSLTSYPPSPYVAGSPNHISLKMDISILSGDSSEELLEPPCQLSPSIISSDESLEAGLIDPCPLPISEDSSEDLLLEPQQLSPDSSMQNMDKSQINKLA